MSFKCLAQRNRSADTERKPASTQPFLVWCSLKSKWVKPFLLNPYIIWPFLQLRSSHKTVKEGWGRWRVKDRQQESGRERGFHFRLSDYFSPPKKHFKVAEGHGVTNCCCELLLCPPILIFSLILTNVSQGQRKSCSSMFCAYARVYVFPQVKILQYT